jgi:selenium-binding protein 1
MTDESHHHDPTFYRSPRDAAAGPPEKLAYVAAFSKPADQPDAIAVVDTDPASASYGVGGGVHRAAQPG